MMRNHDLLLRQPMLLEESLLAEFRNRDHAIRHMGRSDGMAIARIQCGGSEKLREKRLLDIRDGDHARDGDRSRIKRVQRAEEQIERAKMGPDAPLILEENRVLAPAIAGEA